MIILGSVRTQADKMDNFDPWSRYQEGDVISCISWLQEQLEHRSTQL